MGKSKKIKYNQHYNNDARAKYRPRKRESKKKPKRWTGTKGDWEAGLYQTIFIEGEEQRIKKKMCPNLSFDPRKIPEMINPVETDIEKIYKKFDSGGKLNSKEKTKYMVHLSKSSNSIKKDFDSLEKHGRLSKVITREGKIKKTLMNIRHYLDNGDYCNVYQFNLRLSAYELKDELKEQYDSLLPEIEEAVYNSDNIDIYKLQFIKLHGYMPPLNKSGFIKLDEFQVETVKAIDEGLDCIVCAPTSSGKSVLSGYLLTKSYERILIIVPTTPLAWQLDAYATEVYGEDIPILTKSYKSIPKRDELLDLLLRRKAVVGTAETILDYLPLLVGKGVQYDAVIVDEIHMLGNSDCSDMELILKFLMGLRNKPQLLCLSATIGNIHYLKSWIERISSTSNEVKIINCNKRFFNLQKFYFEIDSRSDTGGIINRIHPLSMVSIDEFKDRSILDKNLYPTPPDTWNLFIKLNKTGIDLKDANPYKRFDKKHWITLDESNQLFNDLIKIIIENIDNQEIIDLLSAFRDNTFERSSPNPVDILFTLKKEDKCPCILFMKDTYKCKRLAKQLGLDLLRLQDEKYPNYLKEKMKKLKSNKQVAKKLDKKESSQKNYGHSFDKKKIKEMMNEEDNASNEMEDVSLNEPHPEFILNKIQKIKESNIKDWSKQLSEFFKNEGDGYNYVIDLLWRGVGVYATGLPDPYLRLVQQLASQGELAVVISDKQLVFGVSMPFRSVVIYDDDDLDPLWVKQMEGRAGRRGLDKEGCVIYAGFSWDRIKEISASKIPDIENNDTRIYCLEHAKVLSNNERWDNVRINNFNSNISDEESIEHYEGISDNINSDDTYSWKNFAIRISNPNDTEKKQLDDYNFNFMMWRLRDSLYCFEIALLIKFLEKAFEDKIPEVKSNQIDLANFLLRYIMHDDVENFEENKLPELDFFENEPFNGISRLMKEINLDVPDYCDRNLFNCIRSNTIIDQGSIEKTDKIRSKLLDFAEVLIIIQHYFRHSRKKKMTILFSKLITRLRHIYNDSSPF